MWWEHIYQFISDKRCQENRFYGNCSCKTRKKNPCMVHQETMQAILDVQEGKQSSLDIHQIYQRVRKSTCSLSKSGKCNHLGCIRAEKIQEWLMQKIAI